MNFDLSPAVTQIMGMIEGLIARIPHIVVGAIVFVFFYLASRGINLLVRQLTYRSRLSSHAGLVLGRLSQWFTVTLGLFVSLVIMLPGFTPGQLVQLLGISSVAIGFAFRDILQNFLGGILLLVTEPFRIGDQIVVGNFEGTVEDIQARATTIMTYDGRRVVIPNADLFTDSVIVNTAFDRRRLEYDFGIGYGDDIDLAKQLVLEALNDVEGVLQEPRPDVLVVGLGDFSVDLRVRWWITPPRRSDALDTQDLVITAIKTALEKNGIDLPFPTQQILFHDQTEETDGDRARQREGWPAGPRPAPQPRSIAGSLQRRAAAGVRGNGNDRG